MKRLYFQIVFFFFVVNFSFGQSSHILTGKILDEQALPLVGANIYIPEIHLGASTNSNGYYKIIGLKPGKYIIQYSFIGYETHICEIIISNSDTTVKVELHPTAFQSQEVVVSGGRISSQHENAIKIETINVDVIESSGSSSLMESITLIPGIDVISKSNAVATPVIRGLSTSNILVLNNGVRMENYQFSENHPYLIDEFGISQVEIIKGPASLLYGSDAVGGVLNFIKEKPANPGTINGDANFQYFTNSQGLNGNLGFKGSGQKFYWGVRGGFKSHMDYLEGSGEFVPNSRFNQTSIKGFTGYRSSVGNYRLYYDYVAMKPGMTVEPAIVKISERGRKNENWFQNLNSHMVSSKNTFFLNAFKLEANFAYQYNHRKLNGSIDNPPFTQVDAVLNTLNYEIKSNYTSSDKSNFILAIQGMSQLNKNNEAPSNVLPEYTLNDFAISGLVQHDFPTGIHLQIGLRFDNRFIDVPEQELVGHSHVDEPEDEIEIFEQLKRSYSNVSGSLGITWEINEHFLMRANIASAYRTPNIAELTQDGQHGTRYEQGDRALQSQRNYEGDLSAHFHSKHILIDLAGFYNHINKYIFLTPTTDTTHEGAFIYRYSQNDANLYGLEAIVEVLITHQFGLKGTYNFIRGKQSGGSNLPFIPQSRLNFEIKWHKNKVWIFRDFYLNAGTSIAFDQSHPAPFETYTNSYTLVNAGIGFVINLGVQPIFIDIMGNNLINETYIDHLSTLKNLGFYNPGRNVMLGLKIPFQIKK